MGHHNGDHHRGVLDSEHPHSTDRGLQDNRDHSGLKHGAEGAALGAAGATAGHEVNNHHNSPPVSNSTNGAEHGEENTPDGQRGKASAPHPLNTGGTASHIAEQPDMGLGGLTGKQPVGKIDLKNL
ncbi:hypothetical protein F4703DRAFT_1885798 [Phycomyces blakesleeanus]